MAVKRRRSRSRWVIPARVFEGFQVTEIPGARALKLSCRCVSRAAPAWVLGLRAPVHPNGPWGASAQRPLSSLYSFENSPPVGNVLRSYGTTPPPPNSPQWPLLFALCATGRGTGAADLSAHYSRALFRRSLLGRDMPRRRPSVPSTINFDSCRGWGW